MSFEQEYINRDRVRRYANNSMSDRPRRATVYHAIIILELMDAKVPFHYIRERVQLQTYQILSIYNDVRIRHKLPIENIIPEDNHWLLERFLWMDKVRFGCQINLSAYPGLSCDIVQKYRLFINIKQKNIKEPLTIHAEGHYYLYNDIEHISREYKTKSSDVFKYMQRAQQIIFNI